ncbi:hypothetical protein Leryth_018889, partial [Lithospermum erythrorhizon]
VNESQTTPVLQIFHPDMKQRKTQPLESPPTSNNARNPTPNDHFTKTKMAKYSDNNIFVLCLYGHLTWEWQKGIRSYLHPLIFAGLYKVLAFFNLDKTPWFMIRTPRVSQSIFAAVGDLYVFKLSRLLFGQHVSQWAIFCQLMNWFMFFCITRTLSNSLETVLTVTSLYHWPCIGSSTKNSMRSRKWALVLAALACSIQPTSAIIWVYVGMLELFRTYNRLKFVLLDVAPIGESILHCF